VSSPQVEDLAGAWVLYVAGGRFIDHVQVLLVSVTEDPDWPLRITPVNARDWAGVPNRDLECVVCLGRLHRLEPEWHLQLSDGDSAVMRYALRGDTATGSLTLFTGGVESGGPYSVVGMRIDPTMLVPRSPAQRPSVDSSAKILLEVADIPATDGDFVQRLIARGLFGELAVITSFVGRDGRPDWNQITTWVNAGMGLSAHSRVHSAGTAGSLSFLAEVIGSMEDMSRHGHGTAVFLQPGSWRDSLFFDSHAKITTWRGALLRTFTQVFGAYVYPASNGTGVGDSVALGLGHITISDGATPQTILRVWSYAQRPNSFTVLLIHSFRLPTPDALDWFLDTLAAARQAGRIRLVHSAIELFP